METKIKSLATSTVDFKIQISLNHEQAKALQAMTTYGSKAFLEGYYKQLGKSYMQPHEKGLISLFELIEGDIGKEIKRVETAHIAIITALKNIMMLTARAGLKLLSALMRNGIKLTHKYFTPDEWVTINKETGKYLLEDGVECSYDEFWKWRQDPYWLTDWEIYKGK